MLLCLCDTAFELLSEVVLSSVPDCYWDIVKGITKQKQQQLFSFSLILKQTL